MTTQTTSEPKSVAYMVGYLTTAGILLSFKLVALAFVIAIVIFLFSFAVALGLVLGSEAANFFL